MESPKKNGIYLTDRALDNNKLSWMEKIAAAIIENLSEKGNICYASNEYFAGKLRRTEGGAKNVINGLVGKDEAWKEIVMLKGKTRRVLYLKDMPPYTDEELAKHKMYRRSKQNNKGAQFMSSAVSDEISKGHDSCRTDPCRYKPCRKSTRNVPPIISIVKDKDVNGDLSPDDNDKLFSGCISLSEAIPPNMEALVAYFQEYAAAQDYHADAVIAAAEIENYYHHNGRWIRANGKPVKNWMQAVRGWILRDLKRERGKSKKIEWQDPTIEEVDAMYRRAAEVEGL